MRICCYFCLYGHGITNYSQQLAATKQLVANNSGLLGRWNETEPRPLGWMMSVSVHRRVCTAPSVLITDVRCHLVTSTGIPALIFTLITRDINEISREFSQYLLMIVRPQEVLILVSWDVVSVQIGVCLRRTYVLQQI